MKLQRVNRLSDNLVASYSSKKIINQSSEASFQICALHVRNYQRQDKYLLEIEDEHIPIEMILNGSIVIQFIPVQRETIHYPKEDTKNKTTTRIIDKNLNILDLKESQVVYEKQDNSVYVNNNNMSQSLINHQSLIFVKNKRSTSK